MGSWAWSRRAETRNLLQVLGKLGAVARGRRTSGWPVIAPGGQYPVTGGVVLFPQQAGGDREVAIGLKRFAGAGKALAVITQVDLAESGVDALGVVFGERLKQGQARCLAGGEALGFTGDIEGPGPRQ